MEVRKPVMENTKKKASIWVILLLLSFGVVIGHGLYTFYYAKGFSYFSPDPAACKNCHVMNQVYESWSRGGHQNVATCNDCHLPHDFIGYWIMKAQSGLGHAYAVTFKDNPYAFTANEKTKRVVQENCMDCHKEYVSNVIDPRAIGAAKPFDKNLKEHQGNSSEPLRCISCHREAGHAHNF
jgi:cytochrome c nitrate reductase, small subunit|nr:cytochrome c nitrite reductase small subunit [uncultured Campylobacter sp.]